MNVFTPSPLYIFKCTEFPPTLEKSCPRKDLKLCKKSRVNLYYWGKIRVHYKCGVFLWKWLQLSVSITLSSDICQGCFYFLIFSRTVWLYLGNILENHGKMTRILENLREKVGTLNLILIFSDLIMELK